MKEGERDRTQRMIPYIYPHDGRSFKTIQSYLYFYNTEEKILFFLINSKCSDCSFSGKVGRLTDCGATVPSIKKTLYIYCAQKVAHGVGLTKLI